MLYIIENFIVFILYFLIKLRGLGEFLRDFDIFLLILFFIILWKNIFLNGIFLSLYILNIIIFVI